MHLYPAWGWRTLWLTVGRVDPIDVPLGGYTLAINPLTGSHCWIPEGKWTGQMCSIVMDTDQPPAMEERSSSEQGERASKRMNESFFQAIFSLRSVRCDNILANLFCHNHLPRGCYELFLQRKGSLCPPLRGQRGACYAIYVNVYS